jgi:hypothetical protein
MIGGEATNTLFIGFGLTSSVLKPTTYCSGGEHANQHTTDAVERRRPLH